MPLPQSSILQRAACDVPDTSGRLAPGDADAADVRFGSYTLASAFQPIYSLPHRRLVGHEALLRARGADRRAVSPVEVFRSCTNEHQLSDCDRLARLVHLDGWARRRLAAGPRAANEWLFLNVQPQAFERLALEGGAAGWRELLRQYAIDEGSLVLEVLEAETADPALLAASIAMARECGMLIAIDDFGAGHSNFDRVWRMRPDIVKVDRSLVARAACDASACRILRQMISLLHECGAMVLIEGIETRTEALVAIDCDAEMVQGYLFGTPSERLAPAHLVPGPLLQLHDELAELRSSHDDHRRDRAMPFRRAMTDVVARLAGIEVLRAAGALVGQEHQCFRDACADFLALPGAEACWLLDSDGHQIGPRLLAQAAVSTAAPAHPLAADGGACWLQRPFFRQAADHPGETQVSRPYRSMHGGHLCVTVAVSYPVCIDGLPALRVACGDFRWME